MGFIPFTRARAIHFSKRPPMYRTISDPSLNEVLVTSDFPVNIYWEKATAKTRSRSATGHMRQGHTAPLLGLGADGHEVLPRHH